MVLQADSLLQNVAFLMVSKVAICQSCTEGQDH